MEVTFTVPDITVDQAREYYPVAVAVMSAFIGLILLVGGRLRVGRTIAGLVVFALFIASIAVAMDTLGIEYAETEAQVRMWASELRSAVAG